MQLATYTPVSLWAIRTTNPKGLEFLNESTQGRYYYALSYPTKIVSLWDKSNPSDKGEEYENKVLNKLCVFEDGSVQSLGWDDIFKTFEEAKNAFKKAVALSQELIDNIKHLEDFLK